MGRSINDPSRVTVLLEVIDALAACCLSAYMSSHRRQWAAVQLVKILSSAVNRVQVHSRLSCADSDGNIILLSFYLKVCWLLLVSHSSVRSALFIEHCLGGTKIETSTCLIYIFVINSGLLQVQLMVEGIENCLSPGYCNL